MRAHAHLTKTLNAMKKFLENLRFYAMLGGVFFVLHLTNPDETDFKNYLKNKVREEATKESGLVGAAMHLIAAPLATLDTWETMRTDFFIFSEYRVWRYERDERYFGVATYFVKVN